jgi:transposase InsO family protein
VQGTPDSVATPRLALQQILRILTRGPAPKPGIPFPVGLALATEDTSKVPTGQERDVATISRDEIRAAQSSDPTCQQILAQATRTGLYDLNEEGVLVRIAPSDGSRQVVVPRSLVVRLLFLEHYPPAAGHPGSHRMFQTIRRSFFWPQMVEDVAETVRQCDLCARNRISEKRRTNPLQLFPAKGPLESVAMDILGPLPRTKHGNCLLLVIADRYSKVVKTVPLRTVTALVVARAFFDHWAYTYGPPVSLLMDNGPQFTAKVFQAVCAELGIQKVFTTVYHPQTNGQVERYNRTILASLRGYVAKRQDDWDDYTSAVTFEHNCRVHSSLGMPPFELALTRPPPTLSLEASPRSAEVAPTTLKRGFLERLKTLRSSASGKLHKAQARYKRNYDRGIVPNNSDLKEGDHAYLRVEVTDIGRNHKLESLVQGSYHVVENAGTTFRLQIGNEVVRVSSDRVTRAPTAEEDIPPTSTANERSSSDGASPLPTEVAPPDPDSPVSGPPRTERRVRCSLPKESETSSTRAHRPKTRRTKPSDAPPPTENPNRTTHEYVVDRIVDAVDGVGVGTLVYRVRWLGYDADDDTWEPEHNLPAHFIRRYWRNQSGASPHGRPTLH